MQKRSLFLADDKQTEALGKCLASVLKKGDLLFLRGALGVGKSTLARALIRSLAQDAFLEVPSPTFSLVQYYEGKVGCVPPVLPFPILHADFYRLTTPEEVLELGLVEELEEGVVLIEWPEKAQHFLPTPSLDVFLKDCGKGRSALLSIPRDETRFWTALAQAFPEQNEVM